VLLALIDKGMNRQEAYKIVQSNAMKAWDSREPYLGHLQGDERVTALLPAAELTALFDVGWYLRHVDASFERLGL
jgi:adenylosuccinate lyase